MKQLQGITATGKLGEKPTITFKTPLTVTNNSYAIVQQGDGETITDGDRVCMQGVALNAKTGKELLSTWEKNTPDCSLTINDGDTTTTQYYNLIKGQKINTTIVLGVKDQTQPYIMAMTLVSKEKAMTRAEGDALTDIPADLPKVTLAKDGKPSLDLNGYKPTGKLVVQPLIKGKGATVKESDTINAHYTGWTLDKNGKLTQFDSSWDRGTPTSFSLQQVVKGWTQGLSGQSVGSQVLLIIPPDLGYGSTAQEKIPANSTLYFVVDILHIDS
jgi:peptidylprolyl isomerase